MKITQLNLVGFGLRITDFKAQTPRPEKTFRVWSICPDGWQPLVPGAYARPTRSRPQQMTVLLKRLPWLFRQ